MSSALLLLATIIASTSICVHKDSDQTVTGQTKSLIFCLGASPDGKLLAVGGIRYPTLERRAGVMDLKSKQLRCFGTPKGVMGPTLYVPASWSSDSKQLAFGLLTAPANVPPGYWEQQIMDAAAGKITADDLGYYFQLWTASAETGEARSLSVSNSRHWEFPRFSPDGKRILAYDFSASNVALISVPSRSLLGFLLPSTVWSRAGVHYLGYDWDPAGKAAYLSVGYGGMRKADMSSGIWQIDLASGDKKRLSETTDAFSLFVSASGRWLVYTKRIRNAETGDYSYKIYLASLPDFKTRIVSEHGTEYWVTWSRKGDLLAFCEKGQIAIWTPATNKTVRMPVPEGQPRMPSWVGSTDVIVHGVDNREIWSLDTASGKRKRILTVTEALEKLSADAAKGR